MNTIGQFKAEIVLNNQAEAPEGYKTFSLKVNLHISWKSKSFHLKMEWLSKKYLHKTLNKTF